MSGVSDADGWTWVSLTRSHSEGPHGNRECRDTDTCDVKKDSSGTPLNPFFSRCKTFLAGLLHGALASMEAANDDTKIMEMSCKRAPSVIVPGAFSHYYLCA